MLLSWRSSAEKYCEKPTLHHVVVACDGFHGKACAKGVHVAGHVLTCDGAWKLVISCRKP